MTFLKESVRNDLIELLVKSGMDREKAILMAVDDMPDDLAKMDLIMCVHVASVCYFRKRGDMTEASKGLACLAAIMDEAISRGLAETDFPLSLTAIKDDLLDRGIIPIQ